MASIRICGTDSSVALMVSRYICYITKKSAKTYFLYPNHHDLIISRKRGKRRELTPLLVFGSNRTKHPIFPA
jgi:hypothetical protein